MGSDVVLAGGLVAFFAAVAAMASAMRASARARALEEELERLRQIPTMSPVVQTREDPALPTIIRRLEEPLVVHGVAILHANPRFATLLGREPQDLIGRHLADLVAPGYSELVREQLRRCLEGDPAASRFEVEVAVAGGADTRLSLELTGTALRFEGSSTVLYTALPIQGAPVVETGRPRAQAVLDSLGDALVTTDLQGRIDYVNRRASGLLGRTPAEVHGRLFGDVVSVVDEADRRTLSDPVMHCLASGTSVSLGRRAVVLTSPDGKEHSIDLTASPVRDAGGIVSGATVLLRDVTELRGIARQMSYQASHDALTGLVNRREFERRLEERLEAARGGGQSHVLCYLDLDRFKAVNDTSGHLAGDSMLREIAALAKDAVRDSDTVARIGGDEFALLLVGCPLEKAIQIAQDVAGVIRDFRFVWKDKIFSVGVSIGLVEIGRETTTCEDVLAAADSACYVAKNQAQGHVHVYSMRDGTLARQRGEIHWLQRLQHALKEGRFLLYTQPIVAATSTAQGGPALEVLVRMIGDDSAVIAPGEFLRAAERYRLMSLIDRWVVQTALAALGRGTLRVPVGRSVAINLSGQTLGDPGFLEFVVECLDRTGVQPGQVCFEVTEASVVANIEHARRFIGVLHGMGCSFALDDFGSGLGSFTNLKTLPMDYLKIDGIHIRDLTHDDVNQAMVSAMIQLARTLDFRVIAEQIEDSATLDTVRRMGIDYLQGYAVGRPEPLYPTSH
jgi:diguanylate cyclase (GGDEF)-like protein/PAS domain S-box-containing protein